MIEVKTAAELECGTTNHTQMRSFVSVMISILIGVIGSSAPAIANEDYNEIGKRAYALWDCASLAAVMENNQESGELLFKEGYDLLHVFITARKEGKLTKENTNEVPIGISWYLVDGPTVDFSLGYMWAQFSRHTFDETWDDDFGATFDEREEQQIWTAGNKFREKNCELLISK